MVGLSVQESHSFTPPGRDRQTTQKMECSFYLGAEDRQRKGTRQETVSRPGRNEIRESPHGDSGWAGKKLWEIRPREQHSIFACVLLAN